MTANTLAAGQGQYHETYGSGETRYGDAPTDFGFTGQRRDASTGLMYYRARYYDPTLGRFISADAIVPEPGNPQSLNRYAYVKNNPLRYVDPSGHAPIGPWLEELWGSVDVYQRSWNDKQSSSGPPPWDSLGPRVIPGSREHLYLEAYNLGLAPWQDTPNGSIDDRFDPFSGVDIEIRYQYINKVQRELYSTDVWEMAEVQCKANSCRNPLNDLNPTGPVVVEATTKIVERGADDAMAAFWEGVTGDESYEVYQNDIWNFEPLWTYAVMNIREEELLKAQWWYLDQYRFHGKMMDEPGIDLDFADLGSIE